MTLETGDEPGKLFVGGLSWETTVDKLNEYFRRYGEVTDCVVMKNPDTGRSRGFGFVTFKDPSCVQMVMASGPHSLDGRTIDPKECNPKSAQKGKREAKIGNFPKVFLGGLPPNVNESVLRDYFSKYGKVMEVVIMYDQEKKKTRGNGFRGFGFLSFDSEDTIDKVVAEHFVNINGKQVEIKRAEPRDKSSGKSGGNMIPNQMQQPGPMGGPMPPWNPMWGPQHGPPMHHGPPPPPPPPPPPGQAMPPQTGAPMGIPNGMIAAAYPPGVCWNPAQQTTYPTGASNGWTGPPNYQSYQGWPGYGYPPQGWGTPGYAYGSAVYNTTYPGYGQSSTTPGSATAAVAVAAAPSAVNNAQTPVAQTPITGSTSTSSVVNNVGQYISSNPATITTQAPPIVGPTVASGNATVSAPNIGTYPQEASGFGPSRVVGYSNTNFSSFPLQGQGDAPTSTTYNSASNQTSSFNRATTQAQSYHPYRRVQ